MTSYVFDGLQTIFEYISAGSNRFYCEYIEKNTFFTVKIQILKLKSENFTKLFFLTPVPTNYISHNYTSSELTARKVWWPNSQK